VNNTRKAVLALIAAAITTLSFSTGGDALAATRTSPSAVPLSAGPVCSSDIIINIQTCTTVNGSGLKINWIQGFEKVTVDGNNWPTHIEIYGPNGLIKNCGTYTTPKTGNGPTCTWRNPSPGTSMRAGDYCAATWLNVNGNWEETPECIGVHS
jgi:hypothetical protein